MKATTELRRERKKLFEENNELRDLAAKEDRDLTPEEQEEWNKREERFDELTARIERDEAHEERRARLDEKEAERLEAAERKAHDTGDDSDLELNSDRYRRTWWNAVAYGYRNLPADDQELLSRHVREGEDEGLRKMRAMTTGDLGTGGALVPPGTLGRLYEALKDFGSVERAGAEILQTPNGITFPYPTVNETNVYGERLGENKEATEQDPSLGEVSIGAHIYSSKKIPVPITLIQDSGIAIESFVLRILGERIGRKQNQDWTIETGAGNAPEGVVTGVPAGSVETGATGQSTTIKKADELIDLQHSVDPAYRADGSIGWMMHHQMLREIRKLKDNEGRYMFQPGLREREPDTLLGDRITLNNEMATPAASATTILYGAFRYYLIRRVNEMMLFTLRETGATKMQVEFIGFHRADGKLINAGTSPIVAWKHSSS